MGGERYELIGRVATTRIGAVWKARDGTLDRVVALKQVGAYERESLYREAAALAAIADPHVVTVYGVAEERDHTYLVEEWVEGSTLATVLRARGRLTTAQALESPVGCCSVSPPRTGSGSSTATSRCRTSS